MFKYLKSIFKKEDKDNKIVRSKYIKLKDYKKEYRYQNKVNYASEYLLNRCLNEFKKNLIEYDSIRAKELLNTFKTGGVYCWYMASINLKVVASEFKGLHISQLLKLVQNNKEFDNKVECTVKEFIGKDFIKTITTKTEFKLSLNSFDDCLYASLYLYFK